VGCEGGREEWLTAEPKDLRSWVITPKALAVGLDAGKVTESESRGTTTSKYRSKHGSKQEIAIDMVCMWHGCYTQRQEVAKWVSPFTSSPEGQAKECLSFQVNHAGSPRQVDGVGKMTGKKPPNDTFEETWCMADVPIATVCYVRTDGSRGLPWEQPGPWREAARTLNTWTRRVIGLTAAMTGNSWEVTRSREGESARQPLQFLQSANQKQQSAFSDTFTSYSPRVIVGEVGVLCIEDAKSLPVVIRYAGRTREEQCKASPYEANMSWRHRRIFAWPVEADVILYQWPESSRAAAESDPGSRSVNHMKEATILGWKSEAIHSSASIGGIKQAQKALWATLNMWRRDDRLWPRKLAAVRGRIKMSTSEETSWTLGAAGMPCEKTSSNRTDIPDGAGRPGLGTSKSRQREFTTSDALMARPVGVLPITHGDNEGSVGALCLADPEQPEGTRLGRVHGAFTDSTLQSEDDETTAGGKTKRAEKMPKVTGPRAMPFYRKMVRQQ